MFGKVLITATLVDSFEFANNAPGTWKDRAMKDFVAKLRRETIAYPDWVKKGEDFEAQVYKSCRTSRSLDEALSKGGSDHFKSVVTKCYGGTFQNKLAKNFVVDGVECYGFGFTDVDHSKSTIDIKTTINWRGEDRYLSKFQHKFYLWMNGKQHFEYVVAEWLNKNDNTLCGVHYVPYTNPGEGVLQLEITEKVSEMFDFIRAKGLWNDFYFTFSKND